MPAETNRPISAVDNLVHLADGTAISIFRCGPNHCDQAVGESMISERGPASQGKWSAIKKLVGGNK